MIEPAVATRAGTLRAAGASDPGRVRHNNEDRLYIDLERGVFLVVDGVGGHAAGEVAARVAVDTIVDRLERGGPSPELLVRQAIAAANNEIHRLAQRSIEYAGMTCVVTLALVNDEWMTVGHVGDSRLYKVTARSITKLTRDHSPVGEREDAREISEADAMRHPRRNEVFRDIGSARHGPEDPEFIEVTSAPFEPDAALLLCTDGLTDMLPVAAIERIVWRSAGDPTRVVDALIDAANDAGGRDNVTAVFVEGPLFAVSQEREFSPAQSSVTPLAARSTKGTRRVMWLAIGIALGLAVAAAALVFLQRMPPLLPPRTLVVGTPDGYASIGAAVEAAFRSDVIRIEPGEYVESVVIDDGVHLIARVPGSVTLTAPPGSEGWTSLTVRGRGNRVSGLHLVGRPGAPIATGIKLEGSGAVVDDVSVEGNVDVGIDIRSGEDVEVRANRFLDVRGMAVRIGSALTPTLRQNIFRRGTDEHGPALHLVDGAIPTLEDNVFLGYADPIGAPTSRRHQLQQGNYIIRGATDGSR